MRRAPRRLALAALAVVATTAAGVAAPDDPAKIFPYPIQTTVLDNGLTVISVPYDSPGIIAYYTLVRTGSRNEVEKGLSGFAHFFEHMMFRGTKRFSAEAYNDELKALGANFNASTSDDWTRYYFTLPASALEKVMDLESDRFQNLEYDEAAFQKEARAVLGEYNKSASSPFLKLNETMQNLAYTAHTYKHTTIGFLEDIEDMPNQYEYSRTFFDRWYRPENCAVIVAGDVDNDRLVALAKKYYGDWKRGTAKVDIPAEPPQTEEKTAKLTWPSPTLPILYLGYHIPEGDPRNPDTAALSALAQAYFGETSELYRELVLEKQQVVQLGADSESRRDPGLFTLSALIRSPGDLDAVLGKFEATLAQAAKEPIDPDRLGRIKDHLKYGYANSQVSADSVADSVADSISLTGRPDAMNELFAAYERLTPADLQRVAAKYFAPTNRTVVTLTSEANDR